jgi:hypothetical protein
MPLAVIVTPATLLKPGCGNTTDVGPRALFFVIVIVNGVLAPVRLLGSRPPRRPLTRFRAPLATPAQARAVTIVHGNVGAELRVCCKLQGQCAPYQRDLGDLPCSKPSKRTSVGREGDSHAVGNQGRDEQAVQCVALQPQHAQHWRNRRQPTDARQAENCIGW